MGKVKNWAWDMAETYLDELITKIKDGTLTVATALVEAKTKCFILFNLETSKILKNPKIFELK